MNLGGLAHVVVHLVVDGGLEHVGLGFFGLAERFEVEAEVEVGVAELIGLFGLDPGLGGFHDGFDAACSCKEVMHLRHGDA